MKRIIIIGTRRRDALKDFKIVEKKFLEIYKKGDMIVSGGCKKGGDRFAEKLVRKYNIPKSKIKIFYPDYKTYGRPATFIRNTEVAKFGNEIIACVSSDRTGGTEDTIRKFKKFHPNEPIHIC